MARQIYRKAALDRLASPEKLDTPLRLVSSPGWLVLLCLVLAISGALAWATLVDAPVKAKGQGILINRAGLVEIVTDRAGQLDGLELAPGDLVHAGQVVAHLSRVELRRDLATAQAKLADAQERYNRLESFHREQNERQDQADAERRSTIEETRRLLKERLKLLDERVKGVKSLWERQMVLRDRLIEAEVAASNARERLMSLEEEELRIRLSAIERESEQQLAMLDEKLQVEEQQREVQRLTDRLSVQQVIRSSHDGRIVEIKVNDGDVVQSGTPLATLAPNEEDDLVGVLYVPPAEGKRVVPGMAAEVSPTTVEREVYGHILGEVLSVSPLPATSEGMHRTLQNDQLVSQLSDQGAPIEVRVRLQRDETTPTHFAWSSSRGPEHGVNGGTLIEGQIVIESRPVLSLVLPGAIKRLAARE